MTVKDGRCRSRDTAAVRGCPASLRTWKATQKRHNVVVVGGGFAGLECVAHLDHRDSNVLLVDERTTANILPACIK